MDPPAASGGIARITKPPVTNVEVNCNPGPDCRPEWNFENSWNFLPCRDNANFTEEKHETAFVNRICGLRFCACANAVGNRNANRQSWRADRY